MYREVKNLLRRTGLLPWARVGRAWARRVRYLPENWRYWRGAREDVAVPPLALIDLVSGQPDIPWFLEGGRLGAAAIREALARHEVEMAGLGALLDFGCGCGRVVRRWASIADRVEVHGSDLNPRLIDWCKHHVSFGTFDVNRLEPPLPYPDGKFDLVYSLSVFTHLPARLQRPWIEELRRVVAPGGHLIISTHGERYTAELDPEARSRFAAGELVVLDSEDAGSNACGAYHPPDYVRAHLAAGLDVLEHVSEGALGNPHQDLWIMRRTEP